MPETVLTNSRARIVVASFVAAVFLITVIVVTASNSRQLQSLWEARHDNIRDLQELPLGPVRLEGVVTHVDTVGKRFWIQDESGAIAIDQDPAKAGVRFRQLVRVRATKTHPYDPLVGFASVALTDPIVTVLKPRAELPPPDSATVETLPGREKNGVRVRVEGVLHYVTRWDDGRTELGFGESGQEVLAVATGGGDLSSWIDATVQVTGICETQVYPGGIYGSRYIWVEDRADIQKIQAPPLSAPLYSLRDLYQLPRNEIGHRIRMRGRLVARNGTDAVVIEDPWGIFNAQLDNKVSLPLGTPVEAAGFPTANGVELDLFHSTVTPIDVSELGAAPRPQIAAVTTVAAVKKLTAEEAAAALPVRVTGVVTFADNEWHQMFLQDSTGGIFVKFSSPTRIFQGEKLTVIGLTGPGDYAPVIIAPKLASHGNEKLPRPVAMTARAATGIMDSRFAEVEGVVHPFNSGQVSKHLVFDLYSSFGPIRVQTGPDFSEKDYIRSLEDATVHARGVCAEVFNSRRQLIGLQLMVSSPQDIKVLVPGNPRPFESPATPINQLLRFSSNAQFDHRIKVSGVVTVLGKRFLYVQDQTGGVQIESDVRGLHVADLVDAVGYASPGGYSPVLTDAMVEVRQHEVPVTAQQVTAESLASGQFDSQLVSLEGRVLGVVSSIDSRTLIVRSGGTVFDAVLYVSDSGDSPPAIQEGSVLRLTGICSADVNRSTLFMLITKDRVGFKFVIRSPRDIEVLRPASWWNAGHTVLILSVLAAALVASFTWVDALRRRVRRQSRALRTARKKADAIQQLASAMQEVTRQKQFTPQVSVQGEDEIAQLGVEFNKMLTELQRSDVAKSEAEAKLQHQALTDELTGLPNRRLLSDRLSQTIAMASRESHILALLYLDLDGFKLVNDSLGHTVGDLLLGQVAQRLRSRVRKSDTLARLGGDEFTVILSSLHSADEAGLVAKSLLDVLSTPFLIEEHEITIGASIGISVFPDNASEAADLLQQADGAMYAAKRNGKNRFIFYTPDLGSLVRERLNLENQLRGAISRGEILVYYQPEFEVSTQRLVRFEALARWQHPTLGNIPPSRFIPIAEESGLIIPLGAFVLERACEEAVKWQRLSKDPIQVAVNVSSIQFAAETFVDEVAEVLRHSQLPPDLLQIELTESVMLKGTEPAATTMKRLREIGISIAIDDFGTGYSSLSYLPKLPLNTLKIDRAFVMEIDKRPEMLAMMRSFITLAHNLNLQVVAEGIETVHQLEVITALGGNQVQGFLLGRPTADPTAQLLSANQSPHPDTGNAVAPVSPEFRAD